MSTTQAGVPAHAKPDFQLHILSTDIGAELTDLDVRSLSDAAFQGIKASLGRHHLIVIREQDLTSDDIEGFAMRFGAVEQHVFRQADGTVLGNVHRVSNLDASGKPSVHPYNNANYYWHSDKAYLPRPSWITMLYGVEIPPEGGDTQFVNMRSAYATLPEATQREIDGLRLVNSFDHMIETTGMKRRSPEERAKSPPVEHSLVRIDTEGNKSLFVTMYAQEVVGMPPDRSRALLDRLMAHATLPSGVFTLKWRRRDLVLWNNRALNHRAVANYDMVKYHRLLKRIVVRGEE